MTLLFRGVYLECLDHVLVCSGRSLDCYSHWGSANTSKYFHAVRPSISNGLNYLCKVYSPPVGPLLSGCRFHIKESSIGD